MFNIEVFNTCQMPFWLSKEFCCLFLGGTSQKCVVQSFHQSQWRSLCGFPMENMDWAIIFDTWQSTENWRALPLELDDDQVHYIRNLNNFNVSFYCMHFFNIVRHRIIFILNTKRPISSSFFCEVLQKCSKVWVMCDYFEALHIRMHVHTSNLNTGF